MGKSEDPGEDKHGAPEVDPLQQPARLDACRRCALWHGATQAVPGAGPRHAPIMMVGEQPGDSEDRAGKPFVGPAGQLLDDALSEAGVKRTDVFVTNAVKHFKWEPRGKRRMHKTPAQREIAACRYWLEKELASVGPVVVVALGATALKAVLETRGTPLREVIGQVLEHDGRYVIPTWHPSFALRAPDRTTRERVYADIVQALQAAGQLARDAAGHRR
ncbi:UdgX family uracil-DNA binding protein [Paraburkholderia sp. SARCC-3016]|uniref:UdgX family uracil-DNA binding protein n=1 Tax=Paraburkholderia sp. SARCC-3016 TaxID=3058611 RepID=UPI0028078CF7|nr:UdgX family uracil-DNA binding protein [Paraburkholderia sp. SARCC-3016]MDQ7977619.1 UdgX family uracil-DNA binding protein [Paraburkholderia sp. SARCC-3016]